PDTTPLRLLKGVGRRVHVGVALQAEQYLALAVTGVAPAYDHQRTLRVRGLPRASPQQTSPEAATVCGVTKRGRGHPGVCANPGRAGAVRPRWQPHPPPRRPLWPPGSPGSSCRDVSLMTNP